METCDIKRHPLQLHPSKQAARSRTPRWPSYSGVSQLVGSTADLRCTVYVDPSLGAAGLKNAHDLLADSDRVMKFNDAQFGAAGGHVDVIVFALGGMTDGTGGADHMACDYTNGAQIEVCASFGSSIRVSALFEAELSECSMGGNVCGESTGEALSRWCAMAVSGNALSDFATAPMWFQDGAANFVDTVDPTDRDPDSTGCGMAFISYLLSKGMTLSAISQKLVALGDAGTLALINPAYQWADFMAAVQFIGSVQDDDPFKGSPPSPPPGPTPPPPPGPTPPPPPTPVVSPLEWVTLATVAMFVGFKRGETAAQIKSDVDSIPT